MAIGSPKRLDRRTSQEVCPWNRKLSQDLAVGSPFVAREFIGDKDAVTLATDAIAIPQAEFSAVFKHSPMKRAKPRGLKRNAAAVLRNVGTASDTTVLSHAADDSEPIVRDDTA